MNSLGLMREGGGVKCGGVWAATWELQREQRKQCVQRSVDISSLPLWTASVLTMSPYAIRFSGLRVGEMANPWTGE